VKLRRWTIAASLWVGVVPMAISAQSKLVSADGLIDATLHERIRVELTYLVDLAGDDGGRSTIPLEGIAFRPAQVESVTASIDGEPFHLDMVSTGVGRLTGAVVLPPGRTGRIELILTYFVTSGFEGDDPYRIRIPILAVGWPAAEALPGVFQAEALLAANLKVFESFPSGLVTNSGQAGSVGRFQLDLPAIPALISLRATSGDVAFGGLIQILDGLVLLALATTAVVGFRYLRGTA
jgi:hypothetical protein